jgi:hypothetical protein
MPALSAVITEQANLLMQTNGFDLTPSLSRKIDKGG